VDPSRTLLISPSAGCRRARTCPLPTRRTLDLLVGLQPVDPAGGDGGRRDRHRATVPASPTPVEIAAPPGAALPGSTLGTTPGRLEGQSLDRSEALPRNAQAPGVSARCAAVLPQPQQQLAGGLLRTRAMPSRSSHHAAGAHSAAVSPAEGGTRD